MILPIDDVLQVSEDHGRGLNWGIWVFFDGIHGSVSWRKCEKNKKGDFQGLLVAELFKVFLVYYYENDHKINR